MAEIFPPTPLADGQTTGSQRRVRFLDRLEDTLSRARDAAEITRLGCNLLREQLSASRCIYAPIEAPSVSPVSPSDPAYFMPPVASSGRSREFSEAAMSALRDGKNFIVTDTEQDPRVAGSRAAYRTANVRSLICIPVPVNGPLSAALAVHAEMPRTWSPEEIALAETAAARIWESINHKHTVEGLRESEENLRLALEAGNFGYYAYELGAENTKISARFAEIFGYKHIPQDWSFDKWVAHLHPDDRERVVALVHHSEVAGSDIEYESRFFPAGVEQSEENARWVWLRARYSYRDNGRRYRFGIIADITDRKLAEDALERSRSEAFRQWAELESIYLTAPIGLSLFDAEEFRYIRVNDFQAGTIGLPREKIVGQLFQDIAPGLWKQCEPIFRRVAAGETVRNIALEGELPGQTGVHRYFNVSYTPVHAEDGSVRAIGAVVMEMTAQKRAEQALIQSEKLAAVGRLASSISHEINNPLEAITNLLYIAAGTPGLPTEAAEAISLAERELLRVSQIASQTLRFHRQSTKPTLVTAKELLRPVIALYQGRLANSAIHLTEQHRSHEPLLCFENDIRQVLNNLIGNAIDAMRTSGGDVLIRSREATEWSTGRRGLCITVADAGSGMSATTRKNLFTAFYTTKGISGTGLGLWISRGIMEKHEGTLRFYSTDRAERSGTVFQLFLPRY